jgi:hypothetical protein
MLSVVPDAVTIEGVLAQTTVCGGYGIHSCTIGGCIGIDLKIGQREGTIIIPEATTLVGSCIIEHNGIDHVERHIITGDSPSIKIAAGDRLLELAGECRPPMLSKPYVELLLVV